jgi:hypothetical protein
MHKQTGQKFQSLTIGRGLDDDPFKNQLAVRKRVKWCTGLASYKK